MSLHDLLEKTVTGLGFELVDVEQSPRGRVLRLFIDKPAEENGITVDDCAYVSDHLSRVLTVENVDYERLEISSPGLDRVLKKPADFARFAGREIQVRLRVPEAAGRRNFNGVLQGIAGDQVTLLHDAGQLVFVLTNLEKARLVPNFK